MDYSGYNRPIPSIPYVKLRAGGMGDDLVEARALALQKANFTLSLLHTLLEGYFGAPGVFVQDGEAEEAYRLLRCLARYYMLAAGVDFPEADIPPSLSEVGSLTDDTVDEWLLAWPEKLDPAIRQAQDRLFRRAGDLGPAVVVRCLRKPGQESELIFCEEWVNRIVQRLSLEQEESFRRLLEAARKFGPEPVQTTGGPDRVDALPLSERDKNIVRLFIAGKPLKEIAQEKEVDLSVYTVRNILYRLRKKYPDLIPRRK